VSRPTWAQVHGAGAAATLRDFATRTLVTMSAGEEAAGDRAELAHIARSAAALVELVTADEAWAPVVEAFELVGRERVWDCVEREAER
jgi:hypothetical protein